MTFVSDPFVNIIFDSEFQLPSRWTITLMWWGGLCPADPDSYAGRIIQAIQVKG